MLPLHNSFYWILLPFRYSSSFMGISFTIINSATQCSPVALPKSIVANLDAPNMEVLNPQWGQVNIFLLYRPAVINLLGKSGGLREIPYRLPRPSVTPSNNPCRPA